MAMRKSMDLSSLSWKTTVTWPWNHRNRWADVYRPDGPQPGTEDILFWKAHLLELYIYYIYKSMIHTHVCAYI